MSAELAHKLAEFARRVGDQRYTYEVRVEPEAGSPRKWSFYVLPIHPPGSSGEHLFTGVVEVEPGLVQIETSMSHLPPPFHGQCITCGLIPIIAEHLSADVRSSQAAADAKSRRGVHTVASASLIVLDEMRSPAATRAWEKLKLEQNVEYSVDEDRFYYRRGSEA